MPFQRKKNDFAGAETRHQNKLCGCGKIYSKSAGMNRAIGGYTRLDFITVNFRSVHVVLILLYS